MVGALADHERCAFAGGLDVLTQIPTVDSIPDPSRQCDRLIIIKISEVPEETVTALEH